MSGRWAGDYRPLASSSSGCRRMRGPPDDGHAPKRQPPEFWRRVARALPEYEQCKEWLAEHGGRHVVL